MIKHPESRASRRSVEAKALESNLFRQRRINGKKRKLKVEIEDAETQDELASYREDDYD
jgi:hypothetical protein